MTEALAAVAPNAVYDDHHIFIERLGDMSRAAVAVAGAVNASS